MQKYFLTIIQINCQALRIFKEDDNLSFPCPKRNGQNPDSESMQPHNAALPNRLFLIIFMDLWEFSPYDEGYHFLDL